MNTMKGDNDYTSNTEVKRPGESVTYYIYLCLDHVTVSMHSQATAESLEFLAIFKGTIQTC